MKIEIPNSLLVTLSGVTSRGITAAEVRESDGHLLFTLTDGSRIDLGSVVGPTGAKGETGATGPAGADGYSPTASVQRTETGAIVTITDKTGTSYASVSDGKDGKDGSPGAKGDPGDDYVLTDTDRQEIAASVVAGGLEVEVSDETPGGGGQDGYSPTATVSKSGKVTTITITDKNGTTTAAVEDGEDGAPGAKGDAGATPNIQIGTVTTLDAGADATASMSGTPENPLLNLGIPKGADGGSDRSLGLTGATVGQIAKITAVDESGKPTAWNPVDMPGGGGVWTLVHEQVLTEPAESYTYALDNVRAAALVLFPNAAIDGGWKRVKINNLDVPLTNGKVEAQNGIAFAIDLDAPFKIFGTAQATGRLLATYGIVGSVITSLTADDITEINSIGVATSTLLIAGAKISIYVRE